MTRIAVFGAGAIGCWVGGRLAAGGADVVLVGRPRVLDELRDGVKVSELGGKTWTAKPALATEAVPADLAIVTVKSAQTADAGRALSGAKVVVSLQNGVRNVDALRAALPEARVIAGMVPYNVARVAPGHYHRGTTGTLMFEASDALAPLTEALLRADLPFELRDDMLAVQWGKLVMNLNNALNALAGVPLFEELSDRDFRRCLALAQREALDVLARANIRPARLLKLPPRWIARILPMPDWLFRLIANRVATADPKARSSMWDDLEHGRPTEIDYLQGEIVKLGAAPVNGKLVELIRAAEAGGKRDFTGAELHAILRAS